MEVVVICALARLTMGVQNPLFSQLVYGFLKLGRDLDVTMVICVSI